MIVKFNMDALYISVKYHLIIYIFNLTADWRFDLCEKIMKLKK